MATFGNFDFYENPYLCRFHQFEMFQVIQSFKLDTSDQKKISFATKECQKLSAGGQVFIQIC